MSNGQSSDPNPKNNRSTEKDQYNHSGMIAFMGSMVFVFLFFVYIIAIHPGINLNEDLKTPTNEVVLAEAVVDVSQVSEPWVVNEDMIKHGKKLYAQNCALCHGKDYKGEGDAGKSLQPAPRNLIEGPWKKGGGLIGFYTVLTEGIAGGSMASYAHFKPVDRWALSQFIGSITTAKVAEDPAKVAEFAKTAK